MTHEQMEAHLTLHGWRATEDDVGRDLVRDDGLCVFLDVTDVSHFLYNVNTEHIPLAIDMTEFPDYEFWALAEYICEKGWA